MFGVTADPRDQFKSDTGLIFSVFRFQVVCARDLQMLTHPHTSNIFIGTHTHFSQSHAIHIVILDASKHRVLQNQAVLEMV